MSQHAFQRQPDGEEPRRSAPRARQLPGGKPGRSPLNTVGGPGGLEDLGSNRAEGPERPQGPTGELPGGKNSAGVLNTVGGPDGLEDPGSATDRSPSQRRTISARAAYAVAAAVIALGLFASVTPSPLYHAYATRWHFS